MHVSSHRVHAVWCKQIFGVRSCKVLVRSRRVHTVHLLSHNSTHAVIVLCIATSCGEGASHRLFFTTATFIFVFSVGGGLTARVPLSLCKLVVRNFAW